MTDGRTLERVRRALSQREAVGLPDGGKRRAAVAAVFREPGPELLLIHRTERSDDPWSGHLAFPGGRVDPGDEGPKAAAERETREELSIDLERHDYLGPLDDITGATIPVVVSGFVYRLRGAEVLRPNEEVAEAFWIPVDRLCDPARHTERTFRIRGEARRYPCVDLCLSEKPVLWGLTYRFVRQIAEMAEMPFG